MDAICGSRAPGLSFVCERRTMTNQPLTVWQQITAEFSGHPLSGSYAIEGGVVKVKTRHGEKATQIGALNPEWVARRLLQELAAEGKA
jgi:hypothetical protein